MENGWFIVNMKIPLYPLYSYDVREKGAEICPYLPWLFQYATDEEAEEAIRFLQEQSKKWIPRKTQWLQSVEKSGYSRKDLVNSIMDVLQTGVFVVPSMLRDLQEEDSIDGYIIPETEMAVYYKTSTLAKK